MAPLTTPPVSSRQASSAESVARLFRNALSPGQVMEDEQARRLAASDIAFEPVAPPACVLRPRSLAEVVALVRAARDGGVALHPRGGGWSYTAGYLPEHWRSAIVDTGGLVDSVRIDREAGIVTVGAGESWGAVDAALQSAGLRVPSFGPLSGIGAMVGSTVAQDGGFFGAAAHGAVGEQSVAAATIVDGTGTVRRLDASDRYDPVRSPQPLAGDCGAFGIKTELDLRVIARPDTTVFASFAFGDGAAAIAAMAALHGLPGLGEVFAFDEGIHRNLAATGFSVLEAASVAGDLATAQGPWWDRLGGVLRTARAGRAFLSEVPWSLHVSVDGAAAAAADVRAEAACRVAGFGGEAIPDVIARVTRAKPFRPVKALVGPAGERWLPSHGLVEAAEGGRLLAGLQSVFAASAGERAAHGVRSGFLVALLGRRITIEPQLYWPDALSAYARAFAQPDQVRRYGAMPANLPGRALATRLRTALIAAMDECGAGHFQIGRTYAARPGAPAAAAATWPALKRRFDPEGIMNPGVLGL